LKTGTALHALRALCNHCALRACMASSTCIPCIPRGVDKAKSKAKSAGHHLRLWCVR
jgi:hypothetical protein